ncbi:serine/threonine-protein kinase [Halomonas vilamensis]|uniref:non-specific serine/threonine protein kinase n=1 Tax=Vreelandella vilamensis TaxID=531309 RepID=A0ABU1H418_9GAMM|nr:serine/threonine-protein kinase [Halomonas vilamensis]MDR5898855.1 serine/threonine-protein kinase [Halomonas vilamensis]
MFRVNDCINFEGKEYVVLRFLGQGGMGHVFSIEEKSGGSKFALKFLQHYLPGDNNHRSLINEWEKAQKISHKNTIRYHGFHDGLSEPSTPYLIMDLAHDGSLEDFLQNQTSLMEEDACLGIFHQIIDGMEAVNEILVHRDIKPDNIFIDDGIFKIADFGLAKIAEEKTRSKTFKGWGTEPYIAPEAYRSETNTIQMDMYSIGHVFYQIAALTHAFGSQRDWEHAHITFVPRPLNEVNQNISPKVASVVNKLIAKKPSNRYKTWDCVRKDLVGSAQNVGGHKSAIDKILKSKISRDLEAEKVLSEQQLKEKELKRKNDILSFEFKNEIVQPITEFVDNFNKVSGSSAEMKISEVSGIGDLACKIVFDGKSVNIWFHPLTESDVLSGYANDMWGERRLHITKPTVKGKSVMAWGGVECSDRTGLNIILVSSESDEYGDWYLLKNTHSGLAQRRDTRPDPFAFTSDELVKEIHNVGVMHIYNLNIKPLDITELVDFISSAL